MALREDLTKTIIPLRGNAETEGGSVRIDNKIVIGYESARYDTVLPALTPDLNFDDSINAVAYDVISELLVFQNEMNRLDEYIQFASTYKVTNTKALTLSLQSLMKSF